MFQVSKEYKSYLQECFLNTWWKSRLELGAVNQQAQEGAKVIKNSEFTEYATTDIFDTVKNDAYASFELNRTKANGALKFLGEKTDASGIISARASDALGNIETAVRIRSENAYPLSVKGITLVFAKDVCAVDFTICDQNENVLLSVTGNHQRTYINDFVFWFDTELVLKITKISRPHYRFRLGNVKFGLMLSFDSDRIMTMDFKEALSLISTEMYTGDLSITIDNQSHDYDIENPTSEVHFLEQAQRVKASLSLPLPCGNTETILLGTMYLAEWSTTSSTVTFTAKDRFSFMNDIYDKDVYHDDGISLYDLAEAVLSDAGVESDEYLLDVYLRKVKVKNPLPALTHKEALQLIANAGRCILKQDRNGRILMKSSFVPLTQMTSENRIEYSDMNLTDTPKALYATCEKDLIKADGKSYYLPGDRLTGYVSESLSGSDCVYENEPYIDIHLEAAASLFSLNIYFGSAIPATFTITTYSGQQLVEQLEFTNHNNQRFYLNYSFKECDRIRITFKKANKPFQRVYVSAVTFDTATDKTIRFDDIVQDSLIGTKTETIKQLSMIRTVYTPEKETTASEVKITKLAGDSSETLISFSEPMYEPQLLLNENNCGYEASAWRIKADLAAPQEGSREYTLQLVGRRLLQVKQTVSFVLNPIGTTITMENPLISDERMIKDTGNWIVDYLKSDRDYGYTYMHGDPSLDTNDIIHQDNDYNSDLQVQIYNHELTVAGAVTGKIKGRKVVR